jgi:hypothetical protein
MRHFLLADGDACQTTRGPRRRLSVVRAPNLGSNLESDSPIRSGIDDHLRLVGIRSFGKGVVGIENFRKPEVMSDQSLRVDFPRLNGPKQHGSCDGIHQSGPQGDVMGPESL